LSQRSIKALLDGDILTYRTGFGGRDISSHLACARLDKSIENILKATNASDYQIYLTPTDGSNFRYEVNSDYKANRKAEKPPHFLTLREYMLEVHKAEVAFGMEADDLLGINQTKDTIICTIDKDLRQVPGQHYNFVKDEIFTVNLQEGLLWFYTQMLTGDASDNVSGIRGIGIKKATRLLDREDLSTGNRKLSERKANRYFLQRIIPLYREQYGIHFWEKICNTGALLRIKQEKNEPIWHPMNFLSGADLKKLSQIS